MSVIFEHTPNHSNFYFYFWGGEGGLVQWFGLRNIGPTLEISQEYTAWIHANHWVKRDMRVLCGLKGGGKCTRWASAFLFFSSETGNQFVKGNTRNELGWI